MRDPKSAAPAPAPLRASLPVRKLSDESETPFSMVPDSAERELLARHMGVERIEDLSFAGKVTPEGRKSWRLEGHLTARIGQHCVVTLEPIETALDLTVRRTYSPGAAREGVIALTLGADGEEDDDLPEPLGDEIDLAAVLIEELALAIDPYPRAPGAEIGTARKAPPGAEPLDPEAEKPFAALAALRARRARDE